MQTKRCCQKGGEAGTAAVTLSDKTQRRLRWCELHLEWAREEFTLLLARSAFPGSTEEPIRERLF